MPLQVFPIGALGYCNGLVRTLRQRRSASLDDVASAIPGRELFPQGTQDPRRRLAEYARTLRDLGLAEPADDVWRLTDAGER